MARSVAERWRKIRAQRRAAGLCGKCGKGPPEAGRKVCAACHAYDREYVQRRSAAKRCRICNGSLDGTARICTGCQKAATVSKQEARKTTREWLVQYKLTHPCACCGEAHPACLAFHHPNDDKAAGVSALVGKSLRALRAEVEKCIVLCHNCHAKEHWHDTLQARLLPAGYGKPVAVQFNTGASYGLG